MNREEFAKWASKFVLDSDERPFAPGEKEYFKELIDDSASPEQLMLALAAALKHPFSA